VARGAKSADGHGARARVVAVTHRPSSRDGGARRWTALLAVYVLLVQAFVAGLAAGVQAAPSADRLIGQVLCAEHGTPADGSTPAHLPSCCVLGCLQVATAATPPAVVALAPRSALELGAPTPIVAGALAAPGQRSPRQSRAPPLVS